MWPNPQITADLVTFIEEILMGALSEEIRTPFSEHLFKNTFLRKPKFYRPQNGLRY